MEPVELQLRAAVTGTSGLTQQLLTDAAIALITAITAEQLAQSALRQHHALQGRLLEQATGKTLDAGRVAEVRIVQQPERDAQGQTGSRGGGLS